MVGVERGEVYLVDPGVRIGSEIMKTRPYLVVSPDEMNQKAATFIAVPLTSRQRPYPSRVDCEFRGKTGQVMLDQIQSLSSLRIISKLGVLERSQLNRVLDRLSEMFAP